VRIAGDAPAPNSELLDPTCAHLVSVAVGQHVNVGDLLHLADNTGQPYSEHVHFMT
jgi:hypothetical protein